VMDAGNVNYMFAEANANSRLMRVLLRFQAFYATNGDALSVVVGKNAHLDKLVEVCRSGGGDDIPFSQACSTHYPPYPRWSIDRGGKIEDLVKVSLPRLRKFPETKPAAALEPPHTRAAQGFGRAVDRRLDAKAKLDAATEKTPQLAD
jgi:hypothetical protein